MPTPLDKEDFYRWTIDDRAWKTRVLDHIDAQTLINQAIAERMTVVEVQQKDCAKDASKQSMWISGVVSAIVGGIIQGMTSAFRGNS